MSYYPPKKSTYGDLDFTDDTPPQPTGLPQSMNFPTTDPVGQPSDLNRNRNLSTGFNPLVSPQQPGGPPSVAAMTNSITQEDLLFMRRWQRDSFYYRVVPFTAIGWGGMYLYNRQKQLPHSTLRYFALGALTFSLGKWAYRGELKRRLSENPSNTPFMQGLRKLVGSEPIVATEFSKSGPSYAHESITSSELTSWDSLGAYTEPNFGQSNQDFDRSFGSETSGFAPPKHGSTYEELRAKNRGLIR